MNKAEWVLEYNPKLDSNGNLIQFDVVDDIDFISSLDESLVWTEIWDFDSERPWLIPGCTQDEDGGISWYVCNKPWVDNGIVIEWEED